MTREGIDARTDDAIFRVNGKTMTSSVTAARCLEAFAWQQGADSSQQEREMEAHFERIRAVHPDFQDVTNTSDWALWIEEQDAATQQWVQNGTSNDVNAVISKFKLDMGMKAPTPQEKTLERAKEAASPKNAKSSKVKYEWRKEVLDGR